MTLLALSLAIGLLIDDAVVVREAITHRLEQGEAPRERRLQGHPGRRPGGAGHHARRWWRCSCPVAFMPGIVGQFFKQFGITISVAVLDLAVHLLHARPDAVGAAGEGAQAAGEVRHENAVARLLRRVFEAHRARLRAAARAGCCATRWTTLGITLLVVGGSVGCGGRSLGAEFLPAEDRSQFMVDLTLRRRRRA